MKIKCATQIIHDERIHLIIDQACNCITCLVDITLFASFSQLAIGIIILFRVNEPNEMCICIGTY